MTPKTGAEGRQPRAVAPALVAIAILALVSIWGLAHSVDSANINNAAFALFHICILMTGSWPALRGGQPLSSGTEPSLAEVSGHAS